MQLAGREHALVDVEPLRHRVGEPDVERAFANRTWWVEPAGDMERRRLVVGRGARQHHVTFQIDASLPGFDKPAEVERFFHEPQVATYDLDRRAERGRRSR